MALKIRSGVCQCEQQRVETNVMYSNYPCGVIITTNRYKLINCLVAVFLKFFPILHATTSRITFNSIMFDDDRMNKSNLKSLEFKIDSEFSHFTLYFFFVWYMYW